MKSNIVMTSILTLLTVVSGCLRMEAAPNQIQPTTLQQSFAVVTSDYSTGELLLFWPGMATQSIPIHADSRAVVSSLRPKDLVIVGRNRRDSLLFIDRVTGEVINEHSVGLGTNAQDARFLTSDIVAVSRYHDNRIWLGRLDGYSLIESKLVSLESVNAGADGPAEASALGMVRNFLLIAVQNLANDTFLPMGNSKVVSMDVSDPWNPREVSTVMLKCQNPVTDFVSLLDDPPSDKPVGVYLGGAGHMGYYSKLDGCIERLEVDTDGKLTSTGSVVDESELGGDIVDFEMLSASSGVALVAGSLTEGRVVRFGSDRKLIATFEGRGADLANFLAGVMISVGDAVHAAVQYRDRDGAELTLPFTLPPKSLPPQQIVGMGKP